MRAKLPNDPSRQNLIAAVQSDYQRVSKALAPQLAKLEDEELAAVNVAQNVLRDCLTAVLDMMGAYGHVTAISLAKRVASYALSTVPMEDQDEVVSAFLAGFADFHMMRTAQGAIITTEWQMHDGRRQTNFPKE